MAHVMVLDIGVIHLSKFSAANYPVLLTNALLAQLLVAASVPQHEDAPPRREYEELETKADGAANRPWDVSRL